MQRTVSTVEMPSPLSAANTTVVPAGRFSTPSALPSFQASCLHNRAIFEYASPASPLYMVTMTTLPTIPTTATKLPSTTPATKPRNSMTKTSINRNMTTQKLERPRLVYPCQGRVAARRSADHMSSNLVLTPSPDQVRLGRYGRSVGDHALQATNAITQNTSTCVMSNMTIVRHFTSTSTRPIEANRACLLSTTTTSSIPTLHLSCQTMALAKRSMRVSLQL
jgi:hypothetical protein